MCFCFQAEGGIRDLVRSRGLGDVYKRQVPDGRAANQPFSVATLRPPIGASLPAARVRRATIGSPASVAALPRSAVNCLQAAFFAGLGGASMLPPMPGPYSGDLITVEYRTDPARIAELLPELARHIPSRSQQLPLRAMDAPDLAEVGHDVAQIRDLRVT